MTMVYFLSSLPSCHLVKDKSRNFYELKYIGVKNVDLYDITEADVYQ